MPYSPTLYKFRPENSSPSTDPSSKSDPDPEPKPDPQCPPKSWSGKGLRQVFLELTPACNSRCPGCLNESFIADFSHRVKKSEFHSSSLNNEGWFTVLSRLPKTLKMVTLSGGEPTLYPGFLAILEELENRRLEFSIFSNGRWYDAEDLIGYLKKCHYFKGFRISLHGASAASHDAFSGIGRSFEETINNIRIAIRAKLPVTLSTVITAQNLTELTQMAPLGVELGVEELSFNRYIYTPERFMHLENVIAPPTPSQLQAAVHQIETMRQQYLDQLDIGYGPTIPQCFEESTSQGCSAGEASLVIDPWGNVKPCLHVDLICGNILQQDFETIWSSEPLKMWRGLTQDACSSCSALSECGGGCRAMALSWGKKQDPLMSAPIRQSFIKLEMIDAT